MEELKLEQCENSGKRDLMPQYMSALSYGDFKDDAVDQHFLDPDKSPKVFKHTQYVDPQHPQTNVQTYTVALGLALF